MGFHVPRVTINIDFKEGTSFGELSLISLGYGLHQAWIYSSMFDKGGIFGPAALEAGPFNDALSLAYFVSILVYGLVLLIASIIDTKLVGALHSTPVLASSALLGTVGTLLLLVPGEIGIDLGALQVISGVLTGLGSSVLLLAWGIAFSRRDSASIVINGALSIAIGFGIYGLVLHQIPFPAGGVASALIPLAEFAILLVLRRHVSLDFDNRRLIFQPLPINHARFVLRFSIPVFFLGVALGILRQTSIETVLPGSVFEDQALLFVTACCATVLIMITFLALGADERWHTFFRPLIPFIAVTAVFIPFTADGTSLWGTSIVLVGYMSFEALMWIFFAELAQRFRLSPIFVFGLGRGTMALAALGGSTLPLFSDVLALPASFDEMGTVLIVIIAMMLAYVLLPDEREMASIVAVDPRCTAAVHNVNRTPLIVVNENEGAAGAAETPATPSAAEGTDALSAADWERAVNAAMAILSEGGAAGAAPEASAGRQEGAPGVSAGSEAAGAATDAGVTGVVASAETVGVPANAEMPAPAPSAVAIPAGAQASTASSAGAPVGPEAAATPQAASASAPSNAPAAPMPKPHMDFSRSIFAEDEDDAVVPAPADDSPAARGRFRERCEAVANTYLLSRRENEVMYYLARGYKSSFIQQQLYISEGTAKTHIRHIYRKLNIHSQQELIHLIDEVEL
ncbi:LuxR C-terminal-related transcriptional regulator [uncultured Adlercreutzia sp.]|uniref:LuxR C-terminal-related transcriptional regulator n=1 Tax=uncultured Adlercreutzia sp. TaxID=875803 RepID=UPI0025FCDF33|nr:LuxR C-terminal-related transcriptional regulator [uncultured Adlercreutzia sp.]